MCGGIAEFITGYFDTQEAFRDYMRKLNDDKFLEYEINSERCGK